MFVVDEHKKCKGVKKNVVETKITHDDYRACSLDGKTVNRTLHVIRSYKHDMYTEKVNKIALTVDGYKKKCRKMIFIL
jgi:hypothetical protein